MTLRVGLFLSLNIFMYAGFYFWLARKRWSFIDTLVGAFLLCLAEVFSVEMTLAALGRLGLWETVAVSLVLSAAVWIWTAKDVLAGVKWTCCRLRTVLREMTCWSWIALTLSAAVCVWTVCSAAWAPELGWDANMYHIPIAALRSQEGSLGRLHSAWSWIEGYPQTGEMFILWNVLLLKSQMLADAVQWPFWLFGSLALIGLALKMGAKLPHAIMGSMVWALAPVVILQAREASNDLIVGSLFWIGMNFVYQRPIRLRGLFVALAAAFMIGTKLGALGLVGVLVAFALWNILRIPNKRAALCTFLGLLLCFGVVNSYWYLSNWRTVGNPIWPVGIRLGPLALRGSFSLSGYAESYTPSLLADRPTWQQLWMVWLEPDSYYAHDSKLTGFGPLWIILGIPSIAAWSILERKGWSLILASVLILMTLSLSWHTRYSLFLPGLGGLALAVVLSRLHSPVRVVVQLLVVAGALFSFLVALDVYNIGFFWVPQAYRSSVNSGWPLLGGAYRWLDINTRAPAKLVYGGAVAFPGPLWGEDLRHQVDYVVPSDQDQWQRAVLGQNIEWAFVVIGSREDNFLAGSSHFALVVDDRRIEYPLTLRSRIYRVVGGANGKD